MPGKDFSLQLMLTRKNSEGKEENYGMLTILQGADSTTLTLELSPETKYDADRENIKNNCATNGLLFVQTCAEVANQGRKTYLAGYCIIPANPKETLQALKILFSCSSLSQMSTYDKNQITINLLSDSRKQNTTSTESTQNLQPSSSSSLYNASSSALYTAPSQAIKNTKTASSTLSNAESSAPSTCQSAPIHQDQQVYNDNPPGQGFVMR